MRMLAIIALTLGAASALRHRTKVAVDKPPKIKKCEVPANFVRKVNPKAVTMPTEEEMSRPGFYGEPHLEKVMYINLEKSEKRRAQIEQQISNYFPGVPYQRWAATTKHEAHFLNSKDYSQLGLGQYASPGTQATYYSHRFLLKNISEHKDPNAVFIIVEDDAHLERKGLLDNVLCQIKMLPPEWDFFKFGYMGFLTENKGKYKYPYPGCAGDQINEFTCHQTHWNWNYLGNQAYAVRPKGAAVLVEHLKKVPVMDADGAMMPGITWSKKIGKPVEPETYVSKHNMVGHWGFAGSDHYSLKTDDEEMSLEGAAIVESEEEDFGEDGRETSAQYFKRLQKGETVFDSMEEA